jgi:glycosyltransferase involved in cell wall biosynthesis
MNPIKVLHVVPSYKPAFVYGGPIFSVSSLCEKTAEYGNEVTVFTTTANGKEDLPTHDQKPKNVVGVDVFYFKRRTKGNSNFTPLLLYRLLKTAKKYDVVHIHSWWNLVVLPAVLICLIKGVKPILSVRGTMSSFTFNEQTNSPKALFHRFIGKYMMRGCIIHATSHKELLECQEKIGNSKMFRLPNYINLDDAKDVAKQSSNAVFTIVMLSRLHPVKNIELVLECLGEFSSDFSLVIMGEGEESYVRKLKTIALEKQISKQIEWLGSKSGKEKFEILAAADLFIQMSFTENFGNSVIEAAAVGTPVLISEMIGAADDVRQMELGRIVPLDKQKILDALSIMANDKDRKNRLAKKDKVMAAFYGKELYTQYMNEYDRIINMS